MKVSDIHFGLIFFLRTYLDFRELIIRQFITVYRLIADYID